jgi:hypothetical protein
MNHCAKTVFTVLFALPLTIAPSRASEEDWTVVTVARNGSWGVSNASSLPEAITAAIASCRAMGNVLSDCGAQFRAARGEWVVANLCGTHRIIAAGRSLEDAEREALMSEISLQLVYVSDLPPCKRRVTVNSRGAVVRPYDVHSSSSGD